MKKQTDESLFFLANRKRSQPPAQRCKIVKSEIKQGRRSSKDELMSTPKCHSNEFANSIRLARTKQKSNVLSSPEQKTGKKGNGGILLDSAKASSKKKTMKPIQLNITFDGGSQQKTRNHLQATSMTQNNIVNISSIFDPGITCTKRGRTFKMLQSMPRHSSGCTNNDESINTKYATESADLPNVKRIKDPYMVPLKDLYPTKKKKAKLGQCRDERLNSAKNPIAPNSLRFLLARRVDNDPPVASVSTNCNLSAQDNKPLKRVKKSRMVSFGKDSNEGGERIPQGKDDDNHASTCPFVYLADELKPMFFFNALPSKDREPGSFAGDYSTPGFIGTAQGSGAGSKTGMYEQKQIQEASGVETTYDSADRREDRQSKIYINKTTIINNIVESRKKIDRVSKIYTRNMQIRGAKKIHESLIPHKFDMY